MKMLLKTILISIVSLISFSLLPTSVFAVDVVSPICDGTNGINSSAVCHDNNPSGTANPLFGPSGVLTTAISLLSFLLGIVSVLIIIVAAIKFIVSQGDPQKVTTARNTIIYAVVGIFVASIAQVIVAFVLKKI